MVKAAESASSKQVYHVQLSPPQRCRKSQGSFTMKAVENTSRAFGQNSCADEKTESSKGSSEKKAPTMFVEEDDVYLRHSRRPEGIYSLCVPNG